MCRVRRAFHLKAALSAVVECLVLSLSCRWKAGFSLGMYLWPIHTFPYLLQPIAETGEREGEREVGGKQVPVKDTIMIENCPTSLIYNQDSLRNFVPYKLHTCYWTAFSLHGSQRTTWGIWTWPLERPPRPWHPLDLLERPHFLVSERAELRSRTFRPPCALSTSMLHCLRQGKCDLQLFDLTFAHRNIILPEIHDSLQENETMILLIVKSPSKSNLWNSVTDATPRNLSVNAAWFGKLGEIHVTL